jgi:hypothetical protein
MYVIIVKYKLYIHYDNIIGEEENGFRKGRCAQTYFLHSKFSLKRKGNLTWLNSWLLYIIKKHLINLVSKIIRNTT